MMTNPEGGRYIFDVNDPAEMARLIEQDRFTTRAMGGPFAGLSSNDVMALRTVLDVACGPGDWVLDVAFEQPGIDVVGIDISEVMVSYAAARAYTQHRHNASFRVMDITRPLNFADASFDLVNARFLTNVLFRQSWAPFIAEAMRVLRPGCLLRITEPIDFGMTNSPAYNRLADLFMHALWQRGYGFSLDGRTLGITFILPHLLRSAGYEDIRYTAHALDVSNAAEAWIDFYHNNEIAFYAIRQILVEQGALTQEDADTLYRQMLAELQKPDFYGMGHGLTVWGRKGY